MQKDREYTAYCGDELTEEVSTISGKDIIRTAARAAKETFKMVPYRVDFDLMPWEKPAAGIRFKAYQQAGKRLRVAEFAKDFVEPDWCTKGHIGYVLEGQMEVDFDGEVVRFKPGDGLLIQPGEKHKHKAQALTDIVRIILVEELGESAR